MEFRLTNESMELLIESIVDAVGSTEDRDMQFELVKTILEDNCPYAATYAGYEDEMCRNCCGLGADE